MNKDTPKKSQKIDPVVEAAKKHLAKVDEKYLPNEKKKPDQSIKKKKEQFLINPEQVETAQIEKKSNSKVFYYLIVLPIAIALFFILFFSCTLSVTTLHTQGKADDVIHEQQASAPNIHPDISIPLTGK